MGNWVERQDWVSKAGDDEYNANTSIFCRTRNEERKALWVLSERWEGVVVFSSGGWKARKSSSDQSLGPDCHRNQSRASLPHDHTECASRANSSRVTTLMALLSYAYMLLYETSIQIMGTEGYCLVLLIQPKCDRIPVSDIKAFFLTSKIWHLKEWLGYFVSLSLFSTISSLCVTGKTTSIKLWLWAGTLWSEVVSVFKDEGHPGKLTYYNMVPWSRDVHDTQGAQGRHWGEEKTEKASTWTYFERWRGVSPSSGNQGSKGQSKQREQHDSFCLQRSGVRLGSCILSPKSGTSAGQGVTRHGQRPEESTR